MGGSYDALVTAARTYAPTALPSRGARALAFVAILVGGLCGGLIGWSVTDLQCGAGERTVVVGRAPLTTTTLVEPSPASGDDDSGCSSWAAAGGLVGALTGAGGVGVVAVLVLRAMAEWRRNLDVEELPG